MTNMNQNGQLGMHPLENGSIAAQQTASSAQSKYIRVWEGSLVGLRQGLPVLITKLEGYMSSSASETLAANLPHEMKIVKLISQDQLNICKQYVGKEDLLVFRAMNPHGFLSLLQENKLCAVVQLPSHTLLLSVSCTASRLIGMLFPQDMIVFKPKMSSQQQQMVGFAMGQTCVQGGPGCS